jgi:peptidoglycan/xylan/chitin deacetylase (PgdA/CDA1 family)
LVRVISLRRRRPLLIGLLLTAAFAVASRGAVTRPVAAPGVPGPVYRVATTTKAMALAINVVWGTEYVPKLLSILEAHHARATFFLGGAWAAAHPALVERLVAAGMELGNHGYAHRHQSTMTLDQNVAEITAASRAIEAAGGPRPVLFAPPYGEYNDTVLRAAALLHMPLIMWTVDTIDWRPSSSPSVITSRVLNGASAGAIVLMHPTERTVEALPTIVSRLSADGYRLVTVSQLLSLGTPEGE